MIAPRKPPEQMTPREMIEDSIERLQRAERLLKRAIFLFAFAALEFVYNVWRNWR